MAEVEKANLYSPDRCKAVLCEDIALDCLAYPKLHTIMVTGKVTAKTTEILSLACQQLQQLKTISIITREAISIQTCWNMLMCIPSYAGWMSFRTTGTHSIHCIKFLAGKLLAIDIRFMLDMDNMNIVLHHNPYIKSIKVSRLAPGALPDIRLLQFRLVCLSLDNFNIDSNILESLYVLKSAELINVRVTSITELLLPASLQHFKIIGGVWPGVAIPMNVSTLHMENHDSKAWPVVDIHHPAGLKGVVLLDVCVAGGCEVMLYKCRQLVSFKYGSFPLTTHLHDVLMAAFSIACLEQVVISEVKSGCCQELFNVWTASQWGPVHSPFGMQGLQASSMLTLCIQVMVARK